MCLSYFMVQTVVSAIILLKIVFHLVDPVFLEDSINIFLKEELLRAEDGLFISFASTPLGLVLLPAPTSLHHPQA